MQGPSNGGFIERLKANETLRRITGGRPEIAIFGAPVLGIVIIAAVVVGIVFASGGGGDDGSQVVGETATATRTRPATTRTPANAGLKTPIAFSAGDRLTAADLDARGHGTPGRGEFTGSRLVIPSVGIDAPFSIKVVGGDGQMPNPDGPEDVAWYDFSQWPCCGGVPGKGGNIVLAGHVDYINYGPAVFWRVDEIKLGDRIQIVMQDGTVHEYAVEFNKSLTVGDEDWTKVVEATADESVTLITCTGKFVNGHYTDRQIIWGRKVPAGA